MEVLDDPLPRDAPADTRQTIIFVHGGLHAAWTYRWFQPFFASRGFQTHAVSLRGAGATKQAQSDAVTIAQHVADLSAALDALSPGAPVVLVAHSLGCMTVQKVLETAANPRRVAALVLLAPSAGRGPLPAPARERLPAQVRFAEPASWEERMRGFADRGLACDVALCRRLLFLPTDAAGFDAGVEGDEVLKAHYMPRFAENKLTVDMKSLDPPCAPRDDGFAPPVLAVGAGRDVLTGPQYVLDAADTWGGEVMWVADAPHDLMLHSGWGGVAERVADWLDKRVVREPPAV